MYWATLILKLASVYFSNQISIVVQTRRKPLNLNNQETPLPGHPLWQSHQAQDSRELCSAKCSIVVWDKKGL